MSEANKRQQGGNHYTKIPGEGHWDRQWRLYGRGWFIGNITKYTERYVDKNGIDDLLKAQHYLEKLIELEKAATAGTGSPPGGGQQPLAQINRGTIPPEKLPLDRVVEAARMAREHEDEPHLEEPITEEHEWAYASDKALNQCLKCGMYRGLEPRLSLLPCPATYPFKDKFEPCCECGDMYPRVDLLRGEVFCKKCREEEKRYNCTAKEML